MGKNYITWVFRPIGTKSSLPIFEIPKKVKNEAPYCEEHRNVSISEADVGTGIFTQRPARDGVRKTQKEKGAVGIEKAKKLCLLQMCII